VEVNKKEKNLKNKHKIPRIKFYKTQKKNGKKNEKNGKKMGKKKDDVAFKSHNSLFFSLKINVNRADYKRYNWLLCNHLLKLERYRED
jgi:hypothetical protein